MTTYAGYGVTLLADLKAIPPEHRCDLMCIAVLEKKAWYQFSSASAQAADENLIVAPNTGSGQWLVLGASSSGGGGGGGDGGSTTIFRDNATNPGSVGIVPQFAGQFFVGTDSSGALAVFVAFGTTIGSWQTIYYSAPS